MGNVPVKSGLQGKSELLRKTPSLGMLRNLVDPGTRDPELGMQGCGTELCGVSHAHHRSTRVYKGSN